MKWSQLSSAVAVGGILFLGYYNLQAETLTEAVDEVIQTNPEIRTIAHNRLARDQEVRQARSGYMPRLDVNAGIGTQEIYEPEDNSLTPSQVQLSLRQNIFAGFADMNEVDRQEARVRSAAYHLQGTTENIALKAAKVYIDVLRNQELLALSQQNLETHLRISDQIGLRSDSGIGSRADSDQALGRVALAQSNVVVTQTNLIDAKSNYLAVVGHLPGELQKPTSPDELIPVSLEQAEQIALEKHPTLKSAEADIEARREQYEVAKAPYMPIIDVEVDQTWEEDYDRLEGRDEDLTAMIRLRYNLFQGFKDQARKVETTQQISEAQEIRNNTHRQVVESIRLSWMALQAVMDSVPYREERVRATLATAEAYTKQFNLGKRTLLDVLDTEAELINAKKDLVNTHYDGLYAQYRILNGTGQLVTALSLEWPEESRVDTNDQSERTPIKEQAVTAQTE
ncbi:MAG: TolC family outer membrane protein [Proteobacteria bacterium]|nr:TolC family outer membrane protein [Pseudomonadota bacterium]MBU1231999.1 TolC family outer membrane protein [Pseudomonadota bacterium]MBU1418724.1 TolC family outer membrane protein [Pseudomonadota bacterium]MBU1454470.1 TolC family outer membrane protein [Pseudomonadota bacterium]